MIFLFVAWIEVFLSLPFLVCDFSDLDIVFFYVESFFSSCPLGNMWSSRFLSRLVQRTACIWYVRARNSLLGFAWGVDVLELSCALLFAGYIFPEVFLPLQSCWSLSCDHGLLYIVALSSCEKNHNSIQVKYVPTLGLVKPSSGASSTGFCGAQTYCRWRSSLAAVRRSEKIIEVHEWHEVDGMRDMYVRSSVLFLLGVYLMTHIVQEWMLFDVVCWGHDIYRSLRDLWTPK